MLDYVLLEFG